MTRKISVALLVGLLIATGFVVAGAGRGSAQVEHAVVTVTPFALKPEFDTVHVQCSAGWMWSGPMFVRPVLKGFEPKPLAEIAAALGVQDDQIQNGMQLINAMASEGWELVGPASIEGTASSFTLRIRR